MLSSFTEIPDEVRRRVRGGERVALVLLDAFGLDFLIRHRGHPLIDRLDLTPVQSQFPSTTTAHVPTLHFGVSVEQHGLYEWNILEPSLGEIICPLRFTPAGSKIEGGLAGRLSPSVLAPGPTFYETLGAPAIVLQPRAIEHSSFTRLATRGATVRGFGGLDEGVRALSEALAEAGGYRYGHLYWDLIDLAGHEHGPSSPEFEAASRAALDVLWGALDGLRDVTVLITADHGQVDVSPERLDYLDDVWPQLPGLLFHQRPAGSSRDAFLHVRDGHVATVIEGLSARLGDLAEVRSAAELFDRMGPRLSERLGEVAVLASPGRQVWLRGAASTVRWLRGQHGGLTAAETSTYLARVVG
jgi:hypothetical protein